MNDNMVSNAIKVLKIWIDDSKSIKEVNSKVTIIENALFEIAQDRKRGLSMKPIINIERASEETIQMLIKLGILYTDETGLHVREED